MNHLILALIMLGIFSGIRSTTGGKIFYGCAIVLIVLLVALFLFLSFLSFIIKSC
jgi:hypothetical protein